MKVFFGPKILERGEYPNLSWDHLLQDNSRPFRHGTANLSNIRVPAPHNLAYSKLISFVGRYGKSQKAYTDLDDFLDLSNHKDFSVAELFMAIRRNGATDRLRTEITNILQTDPAASGRMENSCLAYFAEIFSPTRMAPPPASTLGLEQKRIVYFAAPHKNVERNGVIARHLEQDGFVVKLPANEVERECGTPTPDNPDIVRSICISAIKSAQIVLVDVDTYGLDTAWELGYAEGLGKTVIGYSADAATKNTPRMVNRRSFTDNFMHGWGTQPLYASVADLRAALGDKALYVCGSFLNREVRTMKKHLTGKFKSVVFPLDYVPKEPKQPRFFSYQSRTRAIAQMTDCEVVLVVLPRYGMDASWQIGYATAIGKQIVGLSQRDDGKLTSSELVWDHWMHGWLEKDILSGPVRASATLRGYFEAGIVA